MSKLPQNHGPHFGDAPPRRGGRGHRASELTPEELSRYSRHIILPGVGTDGQLSLKRASALIVGVGGLGAPLGLYLAAAGVGRIGLVDYDAVDDSNLHRQVMFGTRDVGRAKLTAAKERLADLNPGIEVVTHRARLTRENALGIIGNYDVVVDGTDNFPARYLINDACVLLGKPDVYGSVFRFEGQVTVFSLPGLPCYRCLYPKPPPPGLVPSCAEGGVFGVLPGIVGAIQANETIKLIVGSGEGLAGRLLMFDALEMKFRELELTRDAHCPVCGDSPTIRELIDYDAFCGAGQPHDVAPSSIPEIEPADLKRRLDSGNDLFILDVREPHERAICDIGGSLIPMGEIPSRVRELDPSRETVVCCRAGHRSAQIVSFLMQRGFENVWNLRGGLHAWSDQVDPTMRKY